MIPPKSNPIFRPAVVDKLSSPDALDELMRVTSPQSWLILVALTALFLVALLWGLLGSIVISVSGHGLLLGNSSTEGTLIKYVVIYVSAQDVAQIRPGMDAQVTPQIARSQGTGFLKGRVSSVSDQPASDKETAGLDRSNNNIFYAVQIDLLPDPTSPDGYQWSNPHGADGNLPIQTSVNAEIIISRRRPIAAVLPGLN